MNKAANQAQERVRGKPGHLVIYLVCAVSLALWLFRLSANDLWFDEAMTVHIIKTFPLITLLPHPYFFLISILVKLFGASEFVLRLPSVIFSLAAMLMLYKTGIRFMPAAVARYAVLFMGLSAFNLWYAQEARPYSLLCLVGISTVYMFLDALETRRTASWLGLILLLVLGVHVHGFFLCMLVGLLFILALALLANLKARIPARKSLLIVILVALCLFISLPRMAFLKDFIRASSGGFWIPRPHLLSIPVTLENFLLGYNLSIGYYRLAFIFIALLLLVAAYLSVRVSRRYRWIKVIWAISIMPFVLAYYFSVRFFPVYIDRGLIFIAPLFYLLLALGICSLKNRGLRHLILAVLVALQLKGIAAYCGNEMPTKEYEHHLGVHLKKGFKQAVSYLNLNHQKGDIVALASISPLYSLKFYGLSCPDAAVKLFFLPGAMEDTNYRPLKENYNNILIDNVPSKGFKRIWLVVSTWDRGEKNSKDQDAEKIKLYMDSHFVQKSMIEIDGMSIFLYSQDGMPKQVNK